MIKNKMYLQLHRMNGDDIIAAINRKRDHLQKPVLIDLRENNKM